MSQTPVTLAKALVTELAGDPDALEQLREMLETAQAERLMKTEEAADRAGIHPKTLLKYNAEGRVRGAVRVGNQSWRFRASEFEILPPTPRDLGAARAGRGTRRLGTSSATAAIRGTDRKAA